MNIDLNTLVAILMIFILILFSILLLHIGRRTKSNVYLAVYFSSQIVGIIHFSFFSLGHNSNSPLLLSVGQSVVFMWGPLFYFFITSLMLPNFKFSLKTLLHFVPALIVFVYVLIVCNLHIRQFMIFESSIVFKNPTFVLSFLFYTSIIAYNIASFITFSLYQKHKANSSANKSVNENWLRIALFGFAISCSIVQIGNNFGEYFGLTSTLKYMIGNLAFLVFFCVLFYVAITNRVIFDKIESIEKYKNSHLTDEDAQRLLNHIEDYMQINKPFIDPKLNLQKLAASLKISERYLSQIINELKKQNFSDFVNVYRVQHAMDLLKDPANKEMTILYVLFEAGFNSKTTFNTTFKKINGSTPIEYKRKMLGI